MLKPDHYRVGGATDLRGIREGRGAPLVYHGSYKKEKKALT